MIIRVHIDRLILEGSRTVAPDPLLLSETVRSELARLLGENGLRADLTPGLNIRSVRSAQRTDDSTSPVQLGTRIAGAVHDVIGEKNDDRRAGP